jgi:invasion protein IalB
VPPTAAAAGQAKGSAWVKLCTKNEQADNKQICLVKYEAMDPNTGMVVVTAAVRSVEGEDKQARLVRINDQLYAGHPRRPADQDR